MDAPARTPDEAAPLPPTRKPRAEILAAWHRRRLGYALGALVVAGVCITYAAFGRGAEAHARGDTLRLVDLRPGAIACCLNVVLAMCFWSSVMGEAGREGADS
jgi:hypothetical protein